ncbi:hypothetical protein [Planctomyces sp. SH-PL14]|uniref:hypothetical protein n=1 Tax=Planctomyces sp. SH-PL14 TaxID=1632864 RepID=UPI0012E88AD5|nr:hypothetical protein [Planctomyces sp. SH-PL14]
MKRVAVPQWDLAVDMAWAPLVPVFAVERLCCRYIADPPDPSGGTPIYLQTASLRI